MDLETWQGQKRSNKIDAGSSRYGERNCAHRELVQKRRAFAGASGRPSAPSFSANGNSCSFLRLERVMMSSRWEDIAKSGESADPFCASVGKKMIIAVSVPSIL